MSWKDMVWICLIAGAVVLGCLAHHVVRDVLFLVEHVVAAGLAYVPSLLRFASTLVR
jgi:hypothetical protein